MNLSRRLFLGGAVAVAASVSVPALAETPVLYADGVNDDAPALNAWMRGEPIRIRGEIDAIRSDGVMALRGGTIALGETVKASGRGLLYIEGVTIVGLKSLYGKPLLDFTEESDLSATFRSCTFDVRESQPARGYI